MASAPKPQASGHSSRTVFNKVGECLYRLQSTGVYYAFVKRSGKQFRRSLGTADAPLARRRLADLRHKIGRLTHSPDARLSFPEVAARWVQLTAGKLKPRSLVRRQVSLKALERFFGATPIRNITRAQCEAWAAMRRTQAAPQTFDHELSALRRVFDYAVDSGLLLQNPAAHIPRMPIRQATIEVPSREQFHQLVAAIRLSDGRRDSQLKAAPGADLVELLAYSGMRLGEATALRWRDVDFDRGVITVTGGEQGTKNREHRVVPMTDALRSLLERLRTGRPCAPHDPVSVIDNAKTTLGKACRRLGLPHFTHHDLRHFFATTCIEAGVDIPTISRWLGHKDGGALAMRVYGHLRQEHSAAQIRRVQFGLPPVTNVIPLAADAEVVPTSGSC